MIVKYGPRKKRSAEERFWDKVNREGENGCWEWTAYILPNGYGWFGLVTGANQRNALAHRVAYEFVVGPVPTGLQLDHLCRNRRCVNPDHLEPVTRRENILRGQSLMAHNARKTHRALQLARQVRDS